jgi:hypothetical protein
LITVRNKPEILFKRIIPALQENIVNNIAPQPDCFMASHGSKAITLEVHHIAALSGRNACHKKLSSKAAGRARKSPAAGSRAP